MTTFYSFLPSTNRAPSFRPTLDGSQYSITILWNISAKRYYVNCQSDSGTLIFMLPLIINPNPIELASLTYDQNNQRVIAKTVAPHGFPIGQVINANITNCVPDKYNGSGLVSVYDEMSVIYPMVQNPGQATTLGVIDYLISMTKGYFISTLVFRNNNFEVNP